MTLNQSPGGRPLHRKHSWPTDHSSLNRSAAIARQTTDFLNRRNAAHCQAARERELKDRIIDLLQKRYGDNPPPRIKGAIAQLNADSNLFQSRTEEAWG